MKILLPLKFILLFILSSAAFAQQSGSIKGKITTADGQPAAFVNIALKNKNLGTTTSENGDYTLNKVKPGNYILKASAVGIRTQEKEIR